jgi:hypothetical protein
MHSVSVDQQQCPLCGATEFKDFRKRERAQCARCGSLPRTRAAWLLLKNCNNLSLGSRVAHFAPERPLAKRLHELCGSGYEAYDFEPERYRAQIDFAEVKKFDLCRNLATLEPGRYDAIVHNHVLEHLPCDYSMVLLRLQALLKPGGVHVFSVPILRGYTKSDLAPTMSTDQRRKIFGHPEHFRSFGTLDHDQNLGMVFGHTMDGYRLEDHVPAEVLLKANIGPAYWGPSGDGAFLVRKDA